MYVSDCKCLYLYVNTFNLYAAACNCMYGCMYVCMYVCMCFVCMACIANHGRFCPNGHVFQVGNVCYFCAVGNACSVCNVCKVRVACNVVYMYVCMYVSLKCMYVCIVMLMCCIVMYVL